jgi:predicted permease
MGLIKLFGDNLLPVLLAAAVGYVLRTRVQVGARSMSRVAFLVFSPCLVFEIIVENHLSGGAMLHMGAFTLIGLLVPGILAGVLARRLGWSRSMTAGVVLTVLLPNAGNFGLSANLFAFGKPGLGQASLFFVTSAVLSYTVGVFVASLGRMSVRQALIGLPKIPTVWAVLLAFVMVRFDWSLPFPVARAVKLLSDATIPVMLVILGMQLHGARLAGRVVPLSLAASLRLIGGAAFGLLLAHLIGLKGAARQAGVLEAAMPSAVISIILATEYDVEPEFVTSVVFATTILCPLTLTPLLSILGAGR